MNIFNQVFTDNNIKKIDKRELTCIEEELLESSPSRSIFTDAFTRALKKEFSRLSRVEDSI